MNLLEHYVTHVYSVEEYIKNNAYVLVDIEYCCHGYKDRIKTLFEKEKWEEVVKVGFYLA